MRAAVAVCMYLPRRCRAESRDAAGRRQSFRAFSFQLRPPPGRRLCLMQRRKPRGDSLRVRVQCGRGVAYRAGAGVVESPCPRPTRRGEDGTEEEMGLAFVGFRSSLPRQTCGEASWGVACGPGASACTVCSPKKLHMLGAEGARRSRHRVRLVGGTSVLRAGEAPVHLF